MPNPFFKNCGPYYIDELLELSDVSKKIIPNKINVNDIKDLVSATNKDVSFFTQKNMKI